jgi:hypothetical protein
MDPDQLRALWHRCPGALIGVATGAVSGIDVLDIDAPRHAEAAAWFDRQRERLPKTRTHRSASGGLHLLFQHQPGMRNWAGRPVIGVDGRADGGYVIWWPAAGERVICDAPPAPWPEWLLVDLARRATPRQKRSRPSVSAGPSVAQFGKRLMAGLVRMVGQAPEGRRNDILFWAACRLGELVAAKQIEPAFGVSALEYAAARAGLDEAELQRTIASGLARGIDDGR